MPRRKLQIVSICAATLAIAGVAYFWNSHFNSALNRTVGNQSMSVSGQPDSAGPTSAVSSVPASEDAIAKAPVVAGSPATRAYSDFIKERIALERSKRPDLVGQPSGPERIALMQAKNQIPADELAKLTTPELAQRISTTSLLVSMVFKHSPDGGLDSFAKSFNGVPEMLRRPDSASVLIDYYKQLTDQIRTEVPDERPHTMAFAGLELVMSAPEIQARMTGDQKRQAISAVIASLDARSQYNATLPEIFYSNLSEQAVMPVAKALEGIDSPGYKLWAADQAHLGVFVARPATRDEINQVFQIARTEIAK